MTEVKANVDRDGVQLAPTHNASNYIPVMDNGTNYRPAAKDLTSHLGGTQEYDHEDTTVFKSQGYVPPSNRDGQLYEDKPLTAKKIAQELQAANQNLVAPHIVKPLTEVAKKMDSSTESTNPVEYPQAEVAATAIGQPRELSDKATTVKEDAPKSSPDGASAKVEDKSKL